MFGALACVNCLCVFLGEGWGLVVAPRTLLWAPQNTTLTPHRLKSSWRLLTCAACLPACLPVQADDTQCPVKVVRGREASAPELNTVLEVSQEYNEQREGVKHSTMQTVSQIIT